MYKNNVKECTDKLVNICREKKNESGNEYIKNSIKNIQDKFHLKLK